MHKRGQRGNWIAPVSLEEMRDVTRLRVILETDAPRQSIGYGDAART